MIEPPQQEATPMKSACKLPDKMRTPEMNMLLPCCMLPCALSCPLSSV
jgi:hypothetical protein